MDITRKNLKQAGHKVILFNFTEGKEANEIVNKMFTADGGAEVQRDTDATGEPLPPTVEWWVGHSSGRDMAESTQEVVARAEILREVAGN
jgi:amidase